MASYDPGDARYLHTDREEDEALRLQDKTEPDPIPAAVTEPYNGRMLEELTEMVFGVFEKSVRAQRDRP